MLQKSMGRQHGVVRLNHSGRHLGRGRNREGQLGLASIVHGKSLEEKGAKTGSSSSARGVKDEEALEASTVISQLADPV